MWCNIIILTLLCDISALQRAPGTSSKIVSMPKNSTMQLEVRKLNSTIISASRPKTSFSADDFLGSMPLNISRRNLLRLQREDYFVTEKSDGVRYLMYVLPGTPSGTRKRRRRRGRRRGRRMDISVFSPAALEVEAIGVRMLVECCIVR